MARLQNSWRLVKASWAVLRSDKELVIFPVVSMIGAMLVTIAFIVPMFAAGLVDALMTGSDNGLVTLIVVFLFYLVMYFVVIFCNTALIGAATIRLNGGDPTLSDGFKIAFERTGVILGYALISATVGMVLRALSERAGILGQIVISIIGFVWNVATFLVVPVLVVENIGPVEAIKRSAALLRKTWGEQLIGNFSIGLVFGLLALLVILVSVPLYIVAASADSVALILALVLVDVVALVGLSLVSSALNGIYQAAVYRYAANGEASMYFSDDLIQGAFRRK